MIRVELEDREAKALCRAAELVLLAFPRQTESTALQLGSLKVESAIERQEVVAE
jgi:hypothetical protein